MDWLTVAGLIEFAGALIIVAHALFAIAALLRHRSLELARLMVANGALAGLNFKVAATLLKTLELHNWQQIAMFVVIFALRTLLKRIFQMDRRMQAAGQAPAGQEGADR